MGTTPNRLEEGRADGRWGRGEVTEVMTPYCSFIKSISRSFSQCRHYLAFLTGCDFDVRRCRMTLWGATSHQFKLNESATTTASHYEKATPTYGSCSSRRKCVVELRYSICDFLSYSTGYASEHPRNMPNKELYTVPTPPRRVPVNFYVTHIPARLHRRRCPLPNLLPYKM